MFHNLRHYPKVIKPTSVESIKLNGNNDYKDVEKRCFHFSSSSNSFSQESHPNTIYSVRPTGGLARKLLLPNLPQVEERESFTFGIKQKNGNKLKLLQVSYLFKYINIFPRYPRRKLEIGL